MTDITRIFNVDTRAFTNVQRKYSGQVNDSISTTLHFEYNPANFLEGDVYVPYIVFNVHDDDGNPLVYGPDSTPVFNGWEFSIPWDVTSRVKTQRVEYQLFFVRTNVQFNGSVAQLDSTEYIQSAMDGIALKRSIECKSKKSSCCPAFAPTTEPNIIGYINLWKDYGVVVPVEQSYDETTNQLILKFHTYNGTNDCEVSLDIAPLVDGKIPHNFLNLIESIDYSQGQVEDYEIPTAKAVIDWLIAEYTPKGMSIAEWESTRTYQANSTVIYNENIYISLQDDNLNHEPSSDPTIPDAWWSTVTEFDLIVNEWSPTPLTNKVPSEYLVKTTLDEKIDTSNLITAWGTPTDVQVASAKLTKDTLDSKVDDSQVVTAWSPVPSDGNVASEKLTKDTLDSKVDDSQIVTQWDATPSDGNIPSEKLTKDTLDSKLDDTQLVTSWGITPSNDSIPSEKLVKDTLDDKTDYRMAIRIWDAETVYGNGSTVIYNNTIWISRGDENVGHVPVESGITSIWWTKIEGGGPDTGTDKFIDIIGDGVSTSYTIHHMLGTPNVFYTMRYNDNQRMFTDADVYLIDDNTIRIDTYDPLEVDSIVIIVTPLMNETSKIVTIGDGQNSDFTIEHNFGTFNYFTSIRDIRTGLFVKANVFALDPMRARVVFSNPPAQSSIHLVLTTTMHVSDGSQSMYSFTNSDTWVVNHNLGKVVLIQAYDRSGNQLTGNVKQDIYTLNSVIIEFNEPLSGFVIVR